MLLLLLLLLLLLMLLLLLGLLLEVGLDLNLAPFEGGEALHVGGHHAGDGLGRLQGPQVERLARQEGLRLTLTRQQRLGAQLHALSDRRREELQMPREATNNVRSYRHREELQMLHEELQILHEELQILHEDLQMPQGAKDTIWSYRHCEELQMLHEELQILHKEY